MKKILKIAGGILGLIIVGILGVIILGRSRLYKSFDVQIPAISIPTDEAARARGEHIASAIAHCGYCHGPDLAGTIFANNPGTEGVIVAPNLTPGEGGIGSDYSTEDWVAAIRHGINLEGRSVMVMPSLFFNHLNEEDLGSLIAYLQSLEPVDNLLPETKPGPMVYALIGAGPFLEGLSAHQIDHDAPFPDPIPAGATIEYGAYVIEISQCRACHGETLAGGQVSPSSPFGPNLTPGGELGGWTLEDFTNVLRTGVHPSGRAIDTYMPWEFFRTMSDLEIEAIWSYLESLEALPTTAP
jgi:mono/diheme cytochrome c family protein